MLYSCTHMATIGIKGLRPELTAKSKEDVNSMIQWKATHHIKALNRSLFVCASEIVTETLDTHRNLDLSVWQIAVLLVPCFHIPVAGCKYQLHSQQVRHSITDCLQHRKGTHTQ